LNFFFRTTMCHSHPYRHSGPAGSDGDDSDGDTAGSSFESDGSDDEQSSAPASGSGDDEHDATLDRAAAALLVRDGSEAAGAPFHFHAGDFPELLPFGDTEGIVDVDLPSRIVDSDDMRETRSSSSGLGKGRGKGRGKGKGKGKGRAKATEDTLTRLMRNLDRLDRKRKREPII
jgi:hypothetical protein